MAEWLCSGLQSRLRRFDSGFSLHKFMSDKNIALIVARLNSSRLPNKNIMQICNKPMISLLIDRVKKSDFVDEVVIATSDKETDDRLEILANDIGIGIYRGPLDNVMGRINGAAKEFNANNIIEILGDNPLVNHFLIDDVAEIFKKNKSDYSATATTEYPLLDNSTSFFSIGLRVQIYKSKVALEYENFRELLGPDDHPSSFIFNNPKHFKISFLEAKGNWAFMNRPSLNFAVNYEKNFKLIKKIFEHFEDNLSEFTLKEMYEFLDENPSLYTLLGPE